MPTNITLNSGTGGERLSTDQIVEAGVTSHAQYVKLLTGSAGMSAAIGGSVADGLLVDVRNVSGAISVSAQGAVNWPVSGKVSGVGTFLVAGKATVVADPQATFFVASSVDTNISVSAQGGVNWPVSGKVSGVGTFLIAGKATVVADPQATFFVASSVDTNISVSAQGGVNWPVSGKVSVVGSTLVSAVGHVLVSGDGNFAVVGKVTVVADPQATFFVTTSTDRRVYNSPAVVGSGSPTSANGTWNPLKYVYINASAAGDLTLVASTASRAIRVIGYALVIDNTAAEVFFQDSQATPIVHAGFSLLSGGGISYAGDLWSPAFQVSVGLGLELKRGATAGFTVKGHMTYLEIS